MELIQDYRKGRKERSKERVEREGRAAAGGEERERQKDTEKET